MSVPVMRMGLVGFADERQLLNLLATRNRNLQWERWPFMDADALWVNGARAQPVRGHMVRVPSADPTKPATVLNLKEIDRPTAFTLPLAGQFTPPFAFDAQRVEQVAEVLNHFEAALLPTAVELTLAAQVAQRRHELASPSYHLTVHGRLVAVVNAAGEIGLAQNAAPHEIAQCDWAGRPAAAAVIPEHFRRTSMARVMWNYAMRNPSDLLPSRYRKGYIHWRRMPAVPSRWVRDEHLLLVSALQTGPQTFEGLVAATGLSPAVVGQGLSALYFAGSLTTDPRKAGPTRQPVPQEDWPSSMTSNFGAPAAAAVIPPRPGRRTRAEMPTAPTPLDPKGDH